MASYFIEGGTQLVKTKKIKLLSLVMTLALVFSSITGMNRLNIVKAAEGDKIFDLVEITDFHGTLLDTSNNQVGAVLADRIKNVEKANPDRTVVIAGGDLYQGSAVSNMLKGIPVQEFMDNIGLDVTALGNHEFDWGLDTVVNNTMKDAKYEIVCANLYNKGTENRVFNPYKIITKDGVKIAFIGAITKETPTIVMPAFVDKYDFKDAVTEINKAAKEIKDGNLADVIIAVIHAGDNLDNKTGEIFDITNKLENINAVFGGHSHSKVYAKGANGLPIYIANSAGKGYADIKMIVSADKKVSFPDPTAADYVALDNDKGYKAPAPVVDASAKALIDAAAEKVKPTTSEVLGTASTLLTRTQDGKPYGSSYLGKWAADVTRKSVDAEVGLQNNGGIRIDIPAGDINVGAIWQIMPFDNTVYKMSMKKADLKAALEQAVMDGGKGIQVSGIKFTYDSAKPSGSRIVDITTEDGKAIADDKVLTVAAPDFVATGGDGFTALKPFGTPDKDSHILLRDAFINDVKTNKAITSNEGLRIVNLGKTISVVATSDVHGTVLNYDYAIGKAPSAGQGLAKVSTYVKGLRASNPNVILVDNGDTIQGTPLSYYYDMLDAISEYPMMKVMGAIGYDSWTLGNHEYNYGLTTLNRIINDAKKENIHVLSANTYKGSSNFVEPYIIKDFTVGGKTIKVGILGLTTKTIPSWEDVAHYVGLQFNDLVDEANLWVPKMKAAGANVIVVAAHTGEESSADVIPENAAKALAAKVDGIDVVLAGHAHSVIPNLDGSYSTKENMLGFVNNEKTGKKVLITEPGKNAQYVSQIDINVDGSGNVQGVTAKVVAMDNTIAEDPAIAALIKPYQDKTLEYVQTVLGTSTDEFKGAGQYVVPTALMDLINKVQMEAAGSQLSIAAPLSASAYIPKGDVTIQSIMGVYVYENFLYGINMTGKQLKDWMEYSVRYYKQVDDPNAKIDITTDYKTLKDSVLNIADYNLDMLYGATYDIDLAQPACTIDTATGRVAVGNRIKNLKVNGKLVKDTDVFNIAINNYRFNGGGGFTKAAGLTIKDANGKDVVDPSLVTYDSGKALGDDGQVRSLMMSYIQKHKTITPDCSNNWKLYTTAVTAELPTIDSEVLPQTGSAVDLGVMVSLGSIIVMLGVALIFVDRRKRKDIAA
jgi:2',3'-cyclic-nucleotide 2'-phosphodiesterase/3'-nucleotidase